MLSGYIAFRYFIRLRPDYLLRPSLALVLRFA